MDSRKGGAADNEKGVIGDDSDGNGDDNDDHNDNDGYDTTAATIAETELRQLSLDALISGFLP